MTVTNPRPPKVNVEHDFIEFVLPGFGSSIRQSTLGASLTLSFGVEGVQALLTHWRCCNSHAFCQPTRHPRPTPTNSWLFVPLLHAGARRLHPHLQQQSGARPIAWQQVHHTWESLQHITAQTGTQLPPAEPHLTTRLATAGCFFAPRRIDRVHLGI